MRFIQGRIKFRAPSSPVAPDTTPDQFTFTDATGVGLGALVTSNTIAISGLGSTDSVAASISGDASSQIQLNAGAWGSGPVTVVNGDTIAVRHTSSLSNLGSVDTVLTAGGVSDTFTSTTVAAAGGTAGQPLGLLLTLTKAV